MDFSGAVKWGIRIVTAAAIFALILVILTSITIPFTPVAGALDGLGTVLAVFYYFVPTASVLFPLMLSMWGLAFVVFATRWAIIGLRTLWRTSA